MKIYRGQNSVYLEEVEYCQETKKNRLNEELVMTKEDEKTLKMKLNVIYVMRNSKKRMNILYVIVVKKCFITKRYNDEKQVWTCSKCDVYSNNLRKMLKNILDC